MHTIDKPKIVVFHPYMLGPNPLASQMWQNYIGQTGTFSLIWHASAPDGTPITPELRVHDELTPGGHPVSGGTGAPGTDGEPGEDGLPGMSAYQLDVAAGFVGTLAEWLDHLHGPKGDDGISPIPLFNGTELRFEDPTGAVLAGPVDLRGAPGADGLTPIPVWDGTELTFEAPAGVPLSAPVDLKGEQGDPGLNGSIVWISSHPTLTGVQVLHIVPAGSPPGTVAQTYNIGMDEIDDFEYVPAAKRLRITTKAGNEFEVDLDFMTAAEIAQAIATALGPYMLTATHDADLGALTGLDGAQVAEAHGLSGGAVAVVRPADFNADFVVSPIAAAGIAVNVSAGSSVHGAIAAQIAAIPSAGDVVRGLVQLAVSTDYPQPANNVDAVTPAYLQAALAAFAATLPADRALAGLLSYNAPTNELTFLMNDGSTVVVDLTSLLNDAVATITTGKSEVYDNSNTLIGYLLPISPTPGSHTFVQKADLSADFDNNDTALSGGISVVRADTGFTGLTAPTLVDANKGLHYAPVTVGNTPLTDAQRTAANTDKVAVALQSLWPVLTNRNTDPAAGGVRNPDGTLGYYSRPSAIGNDADLLSFMNYNGPAYTVSAANATVFNWPSGIRSGQIIEVYFGGTPDVEYYDVNIAADGSILRTAATGRIERASGAVTVRVRRGERWTMWWSGAFWRVLSSFMLNSGSGYREESDGTYTIWGTAIGTTANFHGLTLANANYNCPQATAKTTADITLAAPGDWLVTGAIRA